MKRFELKERFGPLLALVLLLGAISLAQVQGVANQAHSDESQNAAGTPFVSGASGTSQTGNNHSSDQNTQTTKGGTDWTLDALTLALVFVGCAQIWVYCAQRRVMAYQAALTKRAINSSKESSERQLRAYVCVRNIVVEESERFNNAGNHAFTFIVHLKNYGQTPAYKVVVKADPVLLDEPLTVPFPDVGQVIESRLVIGPGQDFTVMGGKIPVTPPAYDLARYLNKKRIYLYGRVNYSDAFSRPRHTDFREYIVWDVNGNPQMEASPYHSNAT